MRWPRRVALVLVAAGALWLASRWPDDRNGLANPDLRDGPCAVPPLDPVQRLEPPTPEAVDTVSTAHLAAWIERLSAPEHGGRRAGTGDTPPIADLLGRVLVEPAPAGLGLAPALSAGPCQAFDVLGQREVNVLARLDPTATSQRTLVLAAHYDGQGRHPTGGPLPGADDNASGVAAVLEALRLLGRRPPTTTTVIVALFGAEEVGLAGSTHWAARRRDDPDAVLVLDMVGRPLPIGDGTGFALRADGSSRLRAWVERASETSGVNLVPIDALGLAAPGRSDDGPLADAGLDVTLLTSGLHVDYHELGDTAEQVDLDQVARAVRLLVALVDVVDSTDTILPPRDPATGAADRMRRP